MSAEQDTAMYDQPDDDENPDLGTPPWDTEAHDFGPDLTPTPCTRCGFDPNFDPMEDIPPCAALMDAWGMAVKVGPLKEPRPLNAHDARVWIQLIVPGEETQMTAWLTPDQVTTLAAHLVTLHAEVSK